MPPDPLPPLAPFPALTPPTDETARAAAPSLLSDDQRADFAFAADLLGGGSELHFQPPAPATPAGGSFLLTPEDAAPTEALPALAAPVSPPVAPRDLLSEEDEPEAGVLSSADGLSLQNLGAALLEEPFPAGADSDMEPGDLGHIELPPEASGSAAKPQTRAAEALPELLSVSEALLSGLSAKSPSLEIEPAPPAEEKPPAAPAPVILPEPQRAPEAEPVIPVEKTPAFSLLGLAVPAAEKPAPLLVEAPPAAPGPVKPESKPSLIIFPSREKDSPAPAGEKTITFPPPRPVPPEESDLPDEEEDVDFDAPLLFPVPSALPDAERVTHHAAAEAAEADGGLGAMLAGALLIGAGIFLVSRVPSLASATDAASAGVAAKSAMLRGEMFLSAVAGAFCLLMGIGAATLRRWAPPIIHAAGWVVLLTALLGLGVGTAALFHFAGNETTGDASPGDGTAMFAGVGIVGVALPLLLIAIFQRPALARLCAVADKRERWTDHASIPALMVVLTGLLLSTAACTMGLSRARFPLFADWEMKHATFFWTLTAFAALAGGILTAAGRRSGWWLLLVITLAMGAALYTTIAGNDWRALFPGGEPQPGTTAAALMAAAAMLPSFLILLMTRKSLTPPHHV